MSELQEQVTLLEGSLATALSASELQAAATTELQQSCETLTAWACQALAIQNFLSICRLPQDHLQEQMQGLQSELRTKTEVAEQQLNSEIELKDAHGPFTFSIFTPSFESLMPKLSKQDLAERQQAEILELRLRGSLARIEKVSLAMAEIAICFAGACETSVESNRHPGKAKRKRAWRPH